jgi:hypothetical protein
MDAEDLKALIDERCRGCQAVVEYRFDAAAEALKLQAKEYEHSIRFLERQVSELQSFKSNMQGRYTVIAVVVSAAISVGILLLNYLIYGVR